MDSLKEVFLESYKSVKNEFIGPENTEELRSHVQDILPLHSSEYKIEHVAGKFDKFTTNISCNLVNEAGAAGFVSKYIDNNNETLRISKTKETSENSPYSSIKYYRCHHNTRYEATMSLNEVFAEKACKRFKNTNCPFSLVIRLSKDSCPSLITVNWNHNHTVSIHSHTVFKLQRHV